MSTYTKAVLETTYNDPSTGTFKSAKPIIASDLRALVTDLCDSVSFPEDTDTSGGIWKALRVDYKTVAALPANTMSTVSGVQRLTANSNGALSVDGLSVSINQSIIVSEESTGSNNGVYTVISPGTAFSKYVLELRSDSRNSSQVTYALYAVTLGVVNEDTIWKQTATSVTSVLFRQIYLVTVDRTIRKLAGFYADVPNSGTSETDLFTYTVPTSTLAEDGDELEFTGAGDFTDAGSGPRIRLYFAGNVVIDTGTLSVVGGANTFNWKLTVVRTGATTAISYGYVEVKISTASVTYEDTLALTSLTLTGTNIIKSTGVVTGGTSGSGDIIAKVGKVMFYPA